jgi:gliding motility-associated protein GldC
MKKSNINISVDLDETKNPVAMEWSATDSGVDGTRPCKGMMISLWDGTDQCTYRIDLWTKDMMVDEMQHMFYETIRGMAETYKRATGDDKISDDITAFAEKFGKDAGLLK